MRAIYTPAPFAGEEHALEVRMLNCYNADGVSIESVCRTCKAVGCAADVYSGSTLVFTVSPMGHFSDNPALARSYPYAMSL